MKELNARVEVIQHYQGAMMKSVFCVTGRTIVRMIPLPMRFKEIMGKVGIPKNV